MPNVPVTFSLGAALKSYRSQIAILLAVTATCLFGRLSFTASIGAFENLDPSQFQQLWWLWRILFWVVPALIVDMLFSRRVVFVAAAVNLFGGLILLAWEFPYHVPVGELLPLPQDAIGMMTELRTTAPFAMLFAWGVQFLIRKLVTQRPV